MAKSLDQQIADANALYQKALRGGGPSAIQMTKRELDRLKALKAPQPAPAAPAPTAADRSAVATIRAVLDQYGLGSLAQTAWERHLDGQGEQFVLAGIADTPEYKGRFPGLDKMRREGRAISEGQWVQWERTARGIMRANGLPESFYDQPSDFAELIDKGVDAQELETRIGAATAVVSGLPQSVRDAAQAEGINLGDLTALWLDPDVAVPAIERKVRQLSVQGAARDAGWGDVSADRANELAARGLDYGQAKTAFDQATALAPLATRQLGDTTDLTRDDIAGAVVGGDAAARRRVQKRAESRAAQGVQGGGYAGTAGGVGGLGSASR